MRRGAWRLLRVFGLFTPLLLVMWLLEGPVVASRGSVIRVDLLTITYPVGAALCGALFGLLEPIAERGRIAAMLCGVLAIFPWVGGLSVAIVPGGQFSLKIALITTAITSTLLGSALGYGYSKPLT
jgi:hypothetical protein